MPHVTRDRRGIALITALFAMVLIAAMIAGAFFASTQEFRTGRNMLVEQRAFAVAEYGLNSEIANWDPARNLPSGLQVGEIDSGNVYVAVDDTAKVKITRLTDNTFWVASYGRANIPQPSLRASRTVNAYVRLAYPQIETKGAIMTAGDITIKGNGLVDGTNKMPTGWECDAFPGLNLPAVYAAPGAEVDAGEKNIVGGIAYDPAAADSNTYIRYGTETWNSLAVNADIKFTPEQLANFDDVIGGDIEPTLDADENCARTLSNWGEPHRGEGSVTACQSRFPIIYADGDLHLNADGRGQGILLVNGSLTLNGGFEFYGLIIVRDVIEKGTGNAHVYGSVMARDATVGNPADTYISGTNDVSYSKCAVESALRGSAILVRVTERSWAQLF